MAKSSYSISQQSPPTHSARISIDKNPFYQTHTIFQRAYGKNLKLEESPQSATDCYSTIWVRFLDPIKRDVRSYERSDGSYSVYLLDCGHEFYARDQGQLGSGTSTNCIRCGEQQGYLALEHEWQHVLFKTNPPAARLFVEAWARDIQQRVPHVSTQDLSQFLFKVLNAFDDIRCNSLWEKVYPGSAARLWERWRRISTEYGEQLNSENFIAFLFAIALGTPTLRDGPFESTRSVVEWGMQSVRYKGYPKLLAIARITIDQCLGALLPQAPPPPQQQHGAQHDPQSQDQGPQETDDAAGRGEEPGPQGQDGSSNPQREAGGDSGSGSSSPEPEAEASYALPEPHPSQVDCQKAIERLLEGAEEIDKSEDHPVPVSVVPSTVSDATRAAVAKALQADLQTIDLGEPGDVDVDMQKSIDAFTNNVAQITGDKQLQSEAKAKIQFLDIHPEDIDSNSRVILTEAEIYAVERMRSVFFRTLGRQKAQRSASGLSIDIDAAIQYDIEPNDPEVFEAEHNNQGFAYLVLSDMSGSMSGPRFQQVCHATEMLKRSLNFPFVDGTLWGFRGGERIQGRIDDIGEAWIYRYAKQCQGYEGEAKLPGRSSWRFPVKCGGLTPMHSATRVAVRHLLSRVSSGMAKRLFLLTDGSPCGTKIGGKGLPHWVLQQYVSKEVQWARQRGIQVYTLVIDGELSDKECKLMFGEPRFWRRVSSQVDSPTSIDRMLQSLVLQNFEKYLRSRG